jgi:hypothetical protein
VDKFMNTKKTTMGRVVICALLMSILSLQAAAQTPALQGAGFEKTSVPARITGAVEDSDRVVLRGGVHRLARAEFDRGAIDDALQANRMVLVLHRSDDQESALRQLLDGQQSKGSGNYHAWLTPDQFGKQFGPADQDVQAVTSWLQSHGLQVNPVGAGKMFIEFTGTVGQVRNAFHTDIHRFVINGVQHYANVSDLQIPAALAPVVVGVTSLHNFPRKSLMHRAGVYRRSKETGEVRPMFTVSSSPIGYVVGPADFAKIYNVPATINGNPVGMGQTIAIVNDSNIDMKDVTAYRTLFGLPANNPTVILNGPDPGIQSGTTGDEGEALLDVELSGAVAPNATIDLIISENPDTLGASGVDLSALYIVDNNLAPVMSESFGDCEPTGGDTFYGALWEQAAAQGITAMVSAGDNGSAACDGGSGSTETAAAGGLAVSGIAATAFNVAVGGTDFNDVGTQPTYWSANNNTTTQESALSYIPETTWNDSCAATGLTGCATVASDGTDLVAGSGGTSNTTPKPSWQTGAGVAVGGNRELPDVSLFASDGPKTNNFYALCEADAVTTPSESCATTGSFEFLGAGGTSASSPAFAGIMAMVNQQTGQRQGNANYVFYKLAAQAGASCDSSKTPANGQLTTNTCTFYDTTAGNNSVACQGGSPNCSNATKGKFGILVDPKNTSNPAWITTAGFDQATGLGSVNVSNLLAKWGTVTFSASATAITASPTGLIAHGANAGFTVKVTSGSGTPTGEVALLASPTASTQVAIGSGTLDGTGAATITTNLLPGGASTVTANYSGDTAFGSSASTPVAVTVGTETSKTTVGLVTFDAGDNITSSSAATAAYGSSYVLRVDVTNSAGTQCSTSTAIATIPCPTGTITLTDNGSALKDFSGSNAAKLSNLGFLEDQPVQLPAGSHALVAAYGGDSSYTASTSPTDAIAITKATTSTALTSSVTTVAAGGVVTLTATITTTSSGVAPTGTVQFSNGTTPLTGTVTYTPTAGSGTPGSTVSTVFVPASLKATLTTTLAALTPPAPVLQRPRRFPPSGYLTAFCVLLLLAYLLLWTPTSRRREYAYAGFLLLALLVTGFAGCGGGSGGGSSGGTTGGGTGAQSITASYSGDSNYQTSKSAATTITVQ